MKKIKQIALSVLGVAFIATGFVACSSDDETTPKTENTTTDTNSVRSMSSSSNDEVEILKREYLNALNSVEYVEINSMLDEFDKKIDQIELNRIESKDDLFNQIKQNINKTKFRNLEEVELEYDLIVEKYTAFNKKNSILLSKIASQELKFRAEIVSVHEFIYKNPILVDWGDNNTTYGGCYFNCVDQLNQCSQAAQQIYEEKMAMAILVGTAFPPAGAGIAANAFIDRRAADRKCAREGLACVDACDN